MFFGPMRNLKNIAFLLVIVCIISMLSGTWCSSTKRSSKKLTKVPKKGLHSGKHVAPDSSRITNGVKATDKEFPYIVALRRKDKPLDHWGAGSILKRPGDISQETEWIITSRENIIFHKSLENPPYIIDRPLNVYPKYSNRAQNLTNYPAFNVKATYCYPWPKKEYLPVADLALIELDRKIELNRPPYFFQSVDMIDKNFDINEWREGAGVITVAGWGWNQTDPPINSETLMKANLYVGFKFYCERFFHSNLERYEASQKFCAGVESPDYTTICDGDTGGPAVINVDGQEKLVGVLRESWKYCKTPGIFEKVAYYRPWIDKVMVEKPRELNCSNWAINRTP